MDAQDAGHARGDGGVHGGDGLGHGGKVVGDQGGQEAGGPELAVGRTDGGYGVHRGGGVEQHPAAAIDLGVDEAGQQVMAGEVHDLKVLPPRGSNGIDRYDAALVDHHGGGFDAAGGQDPAIDERDRHQTVSVTFLRWGGLSGSRPRATASALASR